jgi:hypothetical protein
MVLIEDVYPSPLTRVWQRLERALRSSVEAEELRETFVITRSELEAGNYRLPDRHRFRNVTPAI